MSDNIVNNGDNTGLGDEDFLANIPETMSIKTDPLIPPADLLSSAKTDKVLFVVSKPKGYNYKQVDVFVDQVSRTLAYLERVIVEKDNLAQSLVDEVNDLSEELNTMQYTLEVFRAKGDPLVTQAGEYVTENVIALKNELVQKEEQLATCQARLMSNEAEIATLKEVETQAKKTVNDLNKELADAWDDYDELRKWVDDNIKRLQENAEQSGADDGEQEGSADLPEKEETFSAELAGMAESNQELLAELTALRSELAEKQAENETLNGKVEELLVSLDEKTLLADAGESAAETETKLLELERQKTEAETLYRDEAAKNVELAETLKRKEELLAEAQKNHALLAEQHETVIMEKTVAENTAASSRSAAVAEAENRLVELERNLETSRETEHRLGNEVAALAAAVAEKDTVIGNLENSVAMLKETIAVLEQDTAQSPLLAEAEAEIVSLRARVRSVQQQLDEAKMRERETVADTSKALSALETERELREDAEKKMQEVLHKAAQDTMVVTRWERERNSFASRAVEAEQKLEEVEKRNIELSELLRKEQQEKQELQQVVEHKHQEVAAVQEQFTVLENRLGEAETENLGFVREKVKLETSLETYRERYRETKNLYDVLYAENEVLKESFAADTEENRNAVAEAEKFRHRSQELEKQRQVLEKELVEVREKFASADSEKGLLMSQVAQLESDLAAAAAAEQQMSDLAGQFESADAQVKKLADAAAEKDARIADLEESLTSAEERFNAVKEDLDAVREQLSAAAGAGEDVERLSVQVGEKENEIVGLSEQLNREKAKTKELVREVAENEIRVGELEQRLADAETASDVAVKELAEVREQMGVLSGVVEESKTRVGELEEQLSAAAGAGEQAERLSAQVGEKENEIVDLSEQLNREKAKTKELVREVAENEIRVGELEQRLADVEKELAAAAKAQKQAGVLTGRVGELEQRLADAEKELDEAVEDAKQANEMVEELLSIRSRIDSRKKPSSQGRVQEKSEPVPVESSTPVQSEGAGKSASAASEEDEEQLRIQRLLASSPEITGVDDVPELLDGDGR